MIRFIASCLYSTRMLNVYVTMRLNGHQCIHRNLRSKCINVLFFRTDYLYWLYVYTIYAGCSFSRTVIYNAFYDAKGLHAYMHRRTDIHMYLYYYMEDNIHQNPSIVIYNFCFYSFVSTQNFWATSCACAFCLNVKIRDHFMWNLIHHMRCESKLQCNVFRFALIHFFDLSNSNDRERIWNWLNWIIAHTQKRNETKMVNQTERTVFGL